MEDLEDDAGSDADWSDVEAPNRWEGLSLGGFSRIRGPCHTEIIQSGFVLKFAQGKGMIDD